MDPNDDDVSAKANELKEELAKETGVSPEDVGKILDRLGLTSALQNRQKRGKTGAQGANLARGVAASPLSRINGQSIRIAVGELTM
jgi:hypothetical protein